MNYEEMWNELKNKVEECEVLLWNLSHGSSGNEEIRLGGKAEGFGVVFGWMKDFERTSKSS